MKKKTSKKQFRELSNADLEQTGGAGCHRGWGWKRHFRGWRAPVAPIVMPYAAYTQPVSGALPMQPAPVMQPAPFAAPAPAMPEPTVASPTGSGRTGLPV
jgi:hypothetical protein